MRILSAIAVAILFALLVIFAVENIRPASYSFVGTTIPGNVWWTVAGSALLGFLIACFLLAPGRITAGVRSRRSGRLQQEFEALRGQHERVQAEHARTIAERDQLRSQLAAADQRRVDGATARPSVVESQGTPMVPDAERRIPRAPQMEQQPPTQNGAQDSAQDSAQDARQRDLLPR